MKINLAFIYWTEITIYNITCDGQKYNGSKSSMIRKCWEKRKSNADQWSHCFLPMVQRLRQSLHSQRFNQIPNNKYFEFYMMIKKNVYNKHIITITPTNHSHAKPRSIPKIHERSFRFWRRGVKKVNKTHTDWRFESSSFSEMPLWKKKKKKKKWCFVAHRLLFLHVKGFDTRSCIIIDIWLLQQNICWRLKHTCRNNRFISIDPNAHLPITLMRNRDQYRI